MHLMADSQKHPLRRDALAVHSLHRVVFTVPDLTEAQRFFTTFGLDVRRNDGRLELFTYGHTHCWGLVYEGGVKKRLQYLSFACFAEDFQSLAERIQRADVPHCNPHPLGTREGIWIRHPDGFPIQVLIADKTSPNAKSDPAPVAVVELGRGKAPSRSRAQRVRPRRLAHAVFFTESVDRAVSFYEDVLGLRVSDRSADAVAFLHGVHGSDHHMIAVAKSDGPGLHHISWDVGSVDEVGLGMEQMTQAGYVGGWGLGRHVLGSNYFYYARDPWGSYCEYSFDIDYIPAGLDWNQGDHPKQDSKYVWGPTVPEYFNINCELSSDRSEDGRDSR
jgi:catechol 2,3-dioxygenase-like lactoylglutathione lyase family enzyme